MTYRTACSTLLLIALAGCGSPEPEPTPTPTATVAAPRTLVGAELDFSTLGAKIEGPQGTEIETVLSAGNRTLGKMTSYVACPGGTDVCEPGTMPENTVYTYVHSITLAERDDDAEPQPADGPEAAEETPPTLFRTTAKARGFNAAIGYSRDQAEQALGDSDAITITFDAEQLIWRVTKGEGWKPGTTITFWWQSTIAPKGPESAYLLEVDGNQARATGPFPPEDKPVEGKPRK
ncbi:hypothetical protein [Qipengyuania marisflavi]|uniref:Uncharacterized protein n=1 Tax=Qipengyuania marisflavi TaxID=2486356 RepID=A0A5S3P8S2_9SPHN|nr:hypothetical protein [Qipengyuania marisflavi]TMM49826.1 hypothetical protein FEV51_01090 [Qipengyuania marisflavi]